MGFILFASLLSIGIGYALTDWFGGDGSDEGSDTSGSRTDPAPEGGGDETPDDTKTDGPAKTFYLDPNPPIGGPPDVPTLPTEGTDGDDLILVKGDAVVFDGGDGDDVFNIDTELEDLLKSQDEVPLSEGRIGAVLTGGEGADTYTFDSANFSDYHKYYANHWITDHSYYGEAIEITDFNPAEDQLVIPQAAFYGMEITDYASWLGSDNYDTVKYPFESIAVEPAEDGSYTDVVIYADIVSNDTETSEITETEALRIRLWGLKDFDLNQIKIDEYNYLSDHPDPYATDAPDEHKLDPQPIQFSDGATTDAADNTVLVGNAGAEAVTLTDTEGSAIMTLDGDDTITGSGEGLEIYTGAGDDVIEVTADDTHIDAGEGNDTLVGSSGDDGSIVLSGNEGDDTLTHSDADSGVAHLHGGEGDDTLTGSTGDGFIGGETNIINVDGALITGEEHSTYVKIGEDGPATPSDDWLTLNFPEGTTGELHIVPFERVSGTISSVVTYREADIYYVPEGESFEYDLRSTPGNFTPPENATKVLDINFYKHVSYGAIEFPDFDAVINTNGLDIVVHNPLVPDTGA